VLKAAAAEGCAQGSGVPKAVLKVCQSCASSTAAEASVEGIS